MHILLTGGTGLIGRALCQHWQQQGYTLWVLSRQPHQVPALCSGARGIAHLDELDDNTLLDAVINLAGAPIADRPWTKARRDLLWNSRVVLTRNLVDWMNKQAVPPRILLSGSAVGWYGDRGEQLLNEDSLPGDQDFGSKLCMAWEKEAQGAQQSGTRVVLLRTAPVLEPTGGMLARLLPLFRLGLGGRIGSGTQWMPWIHLEDQVALIDYLLHHESCHGAFNACAPGIVRNSEFTQCLAQTLHRPAIFPAPAWVLRLLLGEMSVLLLGGQHITPCRTQDIGFIWRYPTLDQSLRQLLPSAVGRRSEI